MKLSRSIHDMHSAVGDARRARDVRAMMQNRLALVRDRMPAVEEAKSQRQWAAVLTPEQQREAVARLTPEQRELQKRMAADRGWADGSPVPKKVSEPSATPNYEPAATSKPDRDRDGGRER